MEHLIPIFEFVQLLLGSVKELLLALGAAVTLVLLWRRVQKSNSTEEDELDQ